MITSSSQPNLPRLATSSWLIASLASAIVGLIQYFGVSDAFSPWLNQTVAGEAFANLRQRNQFASLTNIGLLAVLGWAAQARVGSKSKVWKTGLMLSTVLLALGNAASSSGELGSDSN